MINQNHCILWVRGRIYTVYCSCIVRLIFMIIMNVLYILQPYHLGSIYEDISVILSILVLPTL